jgi:hypothetical protein
MKKVLLSAITFCLLSTATVFAQEAGHEQPGADVLHSMKTEVAIQELPEAVLNTLSGEEYQEWTPTTSYIVVDETETEVYAVELQKEEETKSVMFDAQGNKIESEDIEETEEFEGTEGTEEIQDTEETDEIQEVEEVEEVEGVEETEVTEEETEEIN